MSFFKVYSEEFWTAFWSLEKETTGSFRSLEQLRYDFFVLNEKVIEQVDLKVMDQVENRIVNHIARIPELTGEGLESAEQTKLYRQSMHPELGSDVIPSRVSETNRDWLDPEYWEERD